ncbi:hypothetical protein COCVIDRAFT_41943 [Bipolaris victoriae FI3]|uniref:FAD-binding PCMH-type domain-containing protein n=1 Tax=Bipolaris victoriae (strain FI3) TaxID=930091 RepID=W7E1B2_BIPV3|nr:hypothetical protein COCVIDRAFT_41943 [Bipolaris victoriae FI3]
MAAHLVFGLLWSVNLAWAATPGEIQNYLKTQLSSSSEVVLSSSQAYTTEIKQRWDAYDPPSFVVVVKPATANDVATIVRYTSSNSIPFMGTGGGHGYTTTTSALKNGINIDLSGFKEVSIDFAASTMTIGGAVTFVEVLNPTGSCSCVGMVGATIGGGIGVHQGLHGLIIDALQSVTVVTGNGDVNFGLITSATYKLHDQTNRGQALNGDFLSQVSANATIFNALKSFTRNQPDAFAVTSAIQYSHTLNTVVTMVSAVYVGPEKDGRKILQPLLSVKAFKSNVTMIPYNRLPQPAYDMNLYPYDVATYQKTLAAYIDFYATTHLATSYMVTEIFPTRVSLSIPDEATTYPYRAAMAYLFSGFTTDAQTSAITKFAKEIRGDFAKLNGAKGLEVYVNYTHGDEGRNA